MFVNKRGINAVVSTVLIILVIVVAFAVIGSVVISITNNAEISVVKRACANSHPNSIDGYKTCLSDRLEGSRQAQALSEIADNTNIVNGQLVFNIASDGPTSSTKAVRTLPQTLTVGQSFIVTINVTNIAADDCAIAIEEFIPVGSTVTSISDSGGFNLGSGRVAWVLDGPACGGSSSYLLSYTITSLSIANVNLFRGNVTITKGPPTFATREIAIESAGGGSSVCSTNGKGPISTIKQSISGIPITSCGIHIENNANYYYLNNNLTSTVYGQPCILIDGGGVTIDGRNFSINGNYTGAGIKVFFKGADEIKNVRFYNTQVYAISVSNGIQTSGCSPGGYLKILNNAFINSTGRPLELSAGSQNILIANNTFSNTGVQYDAHIVAGSCNSFRDNCLPDSRIFNIGNNSIGLNNTNIP